MKFLPAATILSLTLVARAESESTELCSTYCDRHEDIVYRLRQIYEVEVFSNGDYIFVEENCNIDESNGDFTLRCSYDVPGWHNSYAEYHAKSCKIASTSDEQGYTPKWYSISYGNDVASSWASTDLTSNCINDNSVLLHVPRYMDKPDEVPTPCRPTPSDAPYPAPYSKAPSSDCSHSEYPHSEYPHSEAPFSVVPTSSDAPESEAPYGGCGNPSHQHEDVYYGLINTFGWDNCQQTTSTMDCEAKAFGYRASANFEFESLGDLNYPTELTVTSTYTDPEGSSFQETIDFEEACFEDTENHLRNIKRILNERSVTRSCRNDSGSYAFRNQEFTCLELAGKRLGKLKRVCNSANYPDFAENCRGVCRTGEYCQCVDNPVAFLVGKGKRMTCQAVAELNDTRKTKKCSRTKIRENCPGVCGVGDCAWA